VLLNNLIDNAIRHTPDGGKVDVILARTPGDGVGFEVVDNGPGIPEHELDRVLDRFYRAEGAQGQGSGLGLAIAARVAQRHQVKLTLRNNEGGNGLSASITGL
jgi:two-component system, OmpR family, sensor kinase